jgi:hypothetical protein
MESERFRHDMCIPEFFFLRSYQLMCLRSSFFACTMKQKQAVKNNIYYQFLLSDSTFLVLEKEFVCNLVRHI